MPMDLRDYLNKIDELGELKVVDQEVDWNLEAAAIATQLNRTAGPVALFRNLRGYPAGHGLLAEPFSGTWERPWRRFAVAMDMDADINWKDFLGNFGKRLNPIKPTVVSPADAPCKEVIKIGDKVNLFDLPWPYVHEGDGGRYATMHCIIAKDPDSDWVNWANYRFMVHTRNKLGMPLQYGQQTANLYFYKYEARKQPMPVCIAIGGDPTIFLASGMPFPPGVSEIDFAGGFRGEPIALTRAETNSLYVPADAEIVIEGEVRPYERADEGPFGEYVGYIHGPREPRPVMRVHAITHRRNPMIPFTNEGTRDSVSTSTSVIASIIPAAMYFDLAYGAGLPVTGVAVPTIWPWSMIVISTAIPFPGYIHAVARKIFSVGVTVYPDFLCFVDADVDPTNAADVLEEIVLKAHPLNDFHGLGRYEGPKASLNVYMNNDERKRLLTSKVYIDATTKKWDSGRGPRRMNYESVYPQEVRQRAEQIIQNLTAAKALV